MKRMLYVTALLLQSEQNTLQVGRREASGSFFLSMQEKEPGYKARGHAQGMVGVYRSEGGLSANTETP